MRLLCSIVAAAVLAAPLVASEARAGTCAGPSDRHAFDVEGLKSELMVMALSCGAQPQYNAFVARYQTDIAREEGALASYFKHAYGKGAQKAHDDYITQLANVQSDRGLKLGTQFCIRNVDMFDEVQALHDGAELPDYARGRDIVQPMAFTTCTGKESSPSAPRVIRASSHRPAHRSSGALRKARS